MSTQKKTRSAKKIEYEEEEVVNTNVEENPVKNNISKLDYLKSYEESLSESKNNIEEKFSSDTPKHFEQFWNLIKQMRETSEAPVDTMGAEFCSDPTAERPVYKFHTLISLLLSSQTKDPITFATMEKLMKHGLTVDNILQTEESVIRDMIYGVSFHNNKAKFIKKLAQVLKDEYESDPPEELKELLKLPGIGPKMAHIYLQCCCDKIEGIAVDTHVHRICNRLKFVNETKTPEHTRKDLEGWLPKSLWSDINLVLVGFGQTICSAVAPKCTQCKLNKQCEFGIERIKMLNEKKNRSKSKSKSNISIISTNTNVSGLSSAKSINKSISKSKSKTKSVHKSKSKSKVNLNKNITEVDEEIDLIKTPKKSLKRAFNDTTSKDSEKNTKGKK